MKKEKFNLSYGSLIFAILIILGGLFDIYHVNKSMEEYYSQDRYEGIILDDSLKFDTINNKNENIKDINMHPLQFWDRIFWLIIGFFMILWGLVRVEMWFIRYEYNTLKGDDK